MQQLWRLAKARRPPTLPVSTVLQRVWSPPAGEGRQWAPVPSVTPGALPPPRACPLSTQQHSLSAALAQDGLEDAQEGLGELLFQVVLRVDGQAVLQHKEGVLQAERPGGVTPGGQGLCSTAGSVLTGTGSHWAGGSPGCGCGQWCGGVPGGGHPPGRRIEVGHGSGMAAEIVKGPLAMSCGARWGPQVGVLRTPSKGQSSQLRGCAKVDSSWK